jgi:UDPglucose--hexose-1-phosphate uridylyltransferase
VSEFRQDVTTGAWSLIAPERSRRARAWSTEHQEANVPSFDPSCPFCPGNEHLLPGVISEVPADAGPDWRVRVVPNKYPAVQPDAPSTQSPADRARFAGYGAHRVIIETPLHNADLDALTDIQVAILLETYQAQFSELAQQPGIKSVILFRNRGVRAGATLQHPHSQIISFGMLAPQLATADAWAREHYSQGQACVSCRYVEAELRARDRLIEEGRHFIALVPFAAAGPFEIHVLPLRHEACFIQAQASELSELASLLPRAVRRLKAVIGDTPYNFVIDSATEPHLPYRHWRLRLLPHLVIPGGFESGTGLSINPSQPEEDAELLRAAGT